MNETSTNYQIPAELNKDQSDIDLAEFLGIFYRHKWFIILVTCFFVGITVLYVSTLKPIYEASATIMLDTQKAKITSIEEIYGNDKGNTQYYNSQIQVLESRSLAEKVILRMGLMDNPIFNPILNPTPSGKDQLKEFLINNVPHDWLPPEWFEESEPLNEEELLILLADKFLSQLTIVPYEKSQLIGISFESLSPELSAQICMSIIETYIASDFESKLQMTRKATGWLGERLSSLKQNLDKAEQNLMDYQNQQNLLDVRGVETLSVKELDDISNKLSDARRERAKIESVYKQIKAIKRPTIQQFESIPGVIDNSAVQRAKQPVIEAQTKVIELSKRYGKKHPTMQSAIANYKKSRVNYASVLKNVIKGYEKQYLAAKENEQRLKWELNRSKSDIRNINKKSYKLNELKREVETSRQLYQTFFKRQKETNEATGLESANARIIDPATVPDRPIKPKKKLIVIVAFMFALSLGMIYAFVSESMNKTFRAPVHIEQNLSVPLLGVLPFIKIKRKNRNKPFVPFVEDSRSTYAESIRTIRTAMLLSAMENASKITVVTSSIPNEGKTSVALNLAIAMAKTEKVLLIDGDLRKSSVARMVGIHSENGLVTMINQTSDEDDSIHRFADWQVDILPVGMTPSNPQELLVSREFSQVLDKLSANYDKIIIDSAPVLAVADSLLLLRKARDVVYVVKADATTYPQARSGIDKIKQLKIPITGVILNQFNLKNASGYHNSEYYSGYYDDYGYNESDLKL